MWYFVGHCLNQEFGSSNKDVLSLTPWVKFKRKDQLQFLDKKFPNSS